MSSKAFTVSSAIAPDDAPNRNGFLCFAAKPSCGVELDVLGRNALTDLLLFNGDDCSKKNYVIRDSVLNVVGDMMDFGLASRAETRKQR